MLKSILPQCTYCNLWLLAIFAILQFSYCGRDSNFEKQINTYIKERNFCQADTLLLQRMKSSKESMEYAKLAFLLGKSKADQYKFEEAAMLFDTVSKTTNLTQNSDLWIDATRYKVEMLLKLNQIDRAKVLIDELEKFAQEFNSNKAMGYVLRGNCVYYLRTKNDSLFNFYTQSAIQHAQKNKNEELEGIACLFKGLKFTDRNEMDSAKYFLDLALPLLKKVNHEYYTSICLTNIGSFYNIINEYEKAIDYYLQALDISLKIEFLENTQKIYNNIGLVYQKMNNPKEAAKYIHKSLQVASVRKNIFTEYTALYSLAQLYQNDSFELAIAYLKKLDTVIQNNKILSLQQSMIHHIIGNISEKQNQTFEARKYQESALLFAQRDSNLFEQSRISNALGMLAIKDKNYVDAIKNCSSAYTKSNLIQNFEIMNNSCNCLIESYKKNGNVSQALLFSEQRNVINDSILVRAKRIETSQVQSRLDVKLKEKIRENELLSLTSTLHLKNQRNVYWITLALLLALFLGVCLYLIQKLNKHKLELNNSNIALNKSLALIRKRNIELFESNQNLQNYAEVAAHDINAPLHKILIISDILKTKYLDSVSKDDSKLFEYMSSSCNDLISMTNDLLAFSTITKNLPEKEKVDLNEIVTQVKSKLLEDHSSSSIKINIENALPVFNGHKSLFQQLFLNLFSNSIKYSKTNEPLVVNLKNELAEERNYKISISDNGMGIPLEYQAKIFDLFSKYHKTSQYPGNGIGLSTCKKIINYYGGEIGVNSDGDSGTTIYFTIPV
jgi:signal transduction histidine kinase/tetratricopeptide (TPR) repeat protein